MSENAVGVTPVGRNSIWVPQELHTCVYILGKNSQRQMQQRQPSSGNRSSNTEAAAMIVESRRQEVRLTGIQYIQ